VAIFPNPAYSFDDVNHSDSQYFERHKETKRREAEEAADREQRRIEEGKAELTGLEERQKHQRIQQALDDGREFLAKGELCEALRKLNSVLQADPATQTAD
jgi:hypothetical protein